MNKLTDKNHIRTMILLCVMVYFVSYITRINYAAVILEIVKTEGITKSMASLVTTASFITYGVGQLISGYLGDKIKPKLLVFFGLVVTSVMNLLIPVCGSASDMIAVWCINGFAQAMMWPPMVKIMTNMFSDDAYRTACVKVSWGGSFGTIAVYLVAPFCIMISGWKAVFEVSAILGMIMATVWLIVCGKMEQHTKETLGNVELAQSETVALPLSSGNIVIFLLIMIVIVLQGTLRDGVTTWMPSYISETYHLSSFISILTGVILPIFSILCFQITAWLYQKIIKNELMCAMCIFATSFIASAILSLVSSYNVALSVALSAIITGCMHGVNLLLVCMVPPYLKKYGKVSLISGMLNFCTYIGSAISTYGIAVISEKAGWQVTILCWSIIAFIGTVVCLINKNKWELFRSKA